MWPVFSFRFVTGHVCGIVLDMARERVEIIFRDSHENLTEWTCAYCKEIAVTIRHGVAVCAQHKHLWAVGLQPTSISTEASANH